MSNETAPGRVIVISAPSGAGKTSLANGVLKDPDVGGICFSVSHTTRRPREGERDGQDYFFVDQPAFKRMIEEDAFLEYANVFDRHLYGTSRAFVEKENAQGNDVFLDIDVQGALQVRGQIPSALMVFVFPPSYEVLRERLTNRGLDDPKEIERRLRVASREIQKYKEYDYVIINDDFERSILELKSIVLAARCRTVREELRAEAICRTFRQET